MGFKITAQELLARKKSPVGNKALLGGYKKSTTRKRVVLTSAQKITRC
ncbi:MAG: Uncharacterised protein [Opitutia bacterium UBA7350]|nr:MAG: Uncharacterised protein [Opitutae bacterium UBA7350]